MAIPRVGILLFDDVEVLDFTGPFEVFSVTADPSKSTDTPTPAFEVVLVSESGGSVRARGGMVVETNCSIDTCPQLDILVVPGGMGTRREVDNARLLQWLSNQGKEAKYVTSVCTGSFLLAATGQLDGKRATTHWLSLDRMRDAFPAVVVDRKLHVVKDGNVFTSAGISAGIEMSLLVVADCLGEDVARLTAKHMEYRYPDTNERRVIIDT